MAIDPVKNFFEAVVTSTILSDSTTFTVGSGIGATFIDPAVYGEYNLVFFNATDYPTPDLDPYAVFLRITSVSADTIGIQQPAPGNDYNGEGDSNIARDLNIAGKTYKCQRVISKNDWDRIPDNLSEQEDVEISSPVSGDSLVFEADKWVNKNITNLQGAGGGVTIYYDDDITYDGYGTLTKNPDTATAETEASGTANNGITFIKGFFYDVEIQRTKWNAGEWLFNFWARIDSAVGVSNLLATVFRVPAYAGTLTTSGTGTSRTAVISGSTPFVSGDANADPTLAGYVQTPTGTYQITSFTSSTVVTIETPSDYVNEVDVDFTVHKYLFQVETEEINNTTVTPILYTVRSIQSEIALSETDKAAIRIYAKTDAIGDRTIYFSYNGTEHYSNLRMPIYPKHNDLDGLNLGDYKHLTAIQLSGLTEGSSTNLHTHSYNDLGDLPSIPSALSDLSGDLDDIADGETYVKSENNFTDAYKSKLEGIEALADVTDATNVASTIHGVTAKTPPVDNDEFALIDSAASNVLKKLTWANLKATVASYIATLTQTLTNKRITPRIGTVTSSATITPTGDDSDIYTVTELGTDSTFAAPSGIPTNGQKLILRIRDNGTARNLSWNAIYRVIGVTLPTTTVINKTIYIGCIYNSADSKWDVLAVGEEE